MAEQFTPLEEKILRKTLAHAHEQAWGITFGLLCGLGLFAATASLAGSDGGMALQLSSLRIYFPGYSVTWLGSFIGFVYAFVGGYGVGRTVATIYNRLCPD